MDLKKNEQLHVETVLQRQTDREVNEWKRIVPNKDPVMRLFINLVCSIIILNMLDSADATLQVLAWLQWIANWARTHTNGYWIYQIME